VKEFFVLTYPQGGREIVSRKRKDNKSGRVLEKSSKSCFVSWEIFIFKILERVHSLTEAVLGENIGFSRRTAESAIFNPGI